MWCVVCEHAETLRHIQGVQKVCAVPDYAAHCDRPATPWHSVRVPPKPPDTIAAQAALRSSKGARKRRSYKGQEEAGTVAVA